MNNPFSDEHDEGIDDDRAFEEVGAMEEYDPEHWVCRCCGCSASDPCPGGCVWATPELCSRCAR